MKIVISIVFSLLANIVQAQFSTRGQVQTVTGTLIIPAVQTLKVEKMYLGAISFKAAQALDEGVLIPAFYKITVFSNVPWTLYVKAINNAQGSSGKMPVEIMSLKGNISDAFTKMTKQPQPLLTSTDSLLETVIFVPALFQPGWDFEGGSYDIEMFFTLTPQ
jgi:hypothetical protein